MRTPLYLPLVAALLPSIGLFACTDDPPPPPSELRERLAANLGYIGQETQASLDAAQATLPASSSGVTLGLFGASDPQPIATARASTSPDTWFANRIAAAVIERGARRLAALVPTDGASGTGFDQQIQYLNEHLFTDANYLGDGIYQIPAEMVCTTTVDITGNTTIDATCAHQVELAELRVRVSQHDGTLRFSIQLDAAHDEPLSFELSHTSLEVSVDLDATSRAIAALAPVLGADTPNATLAGQVTGKLDVLGPAHIRLALTIDRALAIKVADPGQDLDGPTAFRFTSAAAEVTTFEVNGVANTGSLAIDVHATTVHTPSNSDLDLPGVSVNAKLAANQPLQLTQIGLGDRTTVLTYNGARALAIDLNPSDGRSLAATLSHDPATGVSTLEVAPRLDLQLAIDHATLEDTAPVYDVTRVQLDGSIRGRDNSRQVEIVSGSLALTTNPASYGFSAAAGQCVTSTTVADSTTGQLYTQYSVVSCL
jgi:hypothetical protein